MSPRVSVIVPSYNHAPFLHQCLTTALQQHGVDLEVIVVDDCSSDDSVAIMRSIDDPRIRVLVNGENIGTYATQNRGMQEATGEFVAILNSDDLWTAGKLPTQVALLEKHPHAAFCYTLGSQIDASGNELDVDQHANWPQTETQDLLPFLLSSNRLLASSVMFRKGDAWFEDSLRYSGDWVAWLQLAARGEAVCVPQKQTQWRQHSANSYTRSKRVTLEEIRVRRSILAAKDRWLLGSPVTRHAPHLRALSDCAVDLAALYILVGEMRLARDAAREAIRLDQSNQAARRRRILSLMPAALARHRLWKSDELLVDTGKLDAQSLIDLP